MANDERAAVTDTIKLISNRGNLFVPLDMIKEGLAAQGLHVCTAADMRVLAIGRAVIDMQVPENLGGGFYFDETSRRKLWDLCELARREGKP